RNLNIYRGWPPKCISVAFSFANLLLMPGSRNGLAEEASGHGLPHPPRQFVRVSERRLTSKSRTNHRGCRLGTGQRRKGFRQRRGKVLRRNFIVGELENGVAERELEQRGAIKTAGELATAN